MPVRDVGLALSLVQGTDLYRILMTDTELFVAAGTQQLCLRVYGRFPGGNVVTENFEGLEGKGAPSKTNSMCGWRPKRAWHLSNCQRASVATAKAWGECEDRWKG